MRNWRRFWTRRDREDKKKGVRTGAKVSVCGDEVREKGALAISSKTASTSATEEVKERREMEEVLETRFQWKVGLERPMFLMRS